MVGHIAVVSLTRCTDRGAASGGSQQHLRPGERRCAGGLCRCRPTSVCSLLQLTVTGVEEWPSSFLLPSRHEVLTSSALDTLSGSSLLPPAPCVCPNIPDAARRPIVLQVPYLFVLPPQSASTWPALKLLSRPMETWSQTAPPVGPRESELMVGSVTGRFGMTSANSSSPPRAVLGLTLPSKAVTRPHALPVP